MIPAGRRRLAREPITGDRRDHDVEGVLRAASEGRGVGERADELDLLEDRAGPSVRDDDRQRALVLRTHVDEVDVESVDLGDELGQGVELRLALAPVVVRRPVAREVLERRERHALRRVRDGLLLRPPRRLDAAFHVGEFLFRKVDTEGADGVGTGRRACFRGTKAGVPLFFDLGHGGLLSRKTVRCACPIQSSEDDQIPRVVATQLHVGIDRYLGIGRAHRFSRDWPGSASGRTSPARVELLARRGSGCPQVASSRGAGADIRRKPMPRYYRRSLGERHISG